MEDKTETIRENLRKQLEYIGEDPEREGLKDTPNRIIRAWDELFAGYTQDPRSLLRYFDAETYDQIVLLRNIELYSMCEHHMLPFSGVAHVAYIPNGKVLGISKLARLVDIYARRLQIQERLGEQVTGFLMDEVGAKGAACIIEASHMCMRMRGCSKQNSVMITSSLKGCFFDEPETRAELLQLLPIKTP
jgi:GTP cyclohydrolase I